MYYAYLSLFFSSKVFPSQQVIPTYNSVTYFNENLLIKILSIGTINTFLFFSFKFSIHISHFSLFPTAASLFSSPIFATTRSFSLPNFPLLATPPTLPADCAAKCAPKLLRPPVTSLTVNTPNHLHLLLEHTTAGCVSLLNIDWLGFVWTLCFIWCSPSDLCK